MAEQISAEGDESFGAMGSGVDAAEKLLARRFDGFKQRFLRFGAGLALVFGSGVADDGFVGRKFALEEVEKSAALRGGHGLVGGDDFLGDSGLGSFPALRQQLAAEEAHVSAVTLAQHADEIAEKPGHRSQL